MTSRVESPVAVVTGAASGIGRAFVLALAQRGYACVGSDVNERGLQALADAVAGSAGSVSVLRADVSDAQDVKRLAERSIERHGRVDLLINNAGILSTGRTWEMPLDQWRRVLEVNLFGLVNALHSFVPRMLAQGSGHIVNMASAAALTSHAFVGAYSASKHSVLALSESLARELEAVGSNVRVSVVFPTAVSTDIARGLGERPAGEAPPIDRLLMDLSASGMSAADLVDFVLAALDQGAFAIFPHPAVRKRAAERIDGLLGNLRSAR